jgi:uncharacterized membrane protein YpjA
MISDIYDVFSLINLVLALVCVFMAIRMMVKYRSLRLVHGLIAVFSAFLVGLYTYIFFFHPLLGEVTAALGRIGVTLLFASIIMLMSIMDK